MPYYRRGYRRRWRIGRRYRRRLYRRSYARRYVNGSSRSSIRMKCVVTGSSTLKSGYGDTLSDASFRIVPLAKAIAGTNVVPLTSSPLFTAYQNLYEEMKMIGMKVAVSVTDQIGGSTLPSLQIYTAWDRRHGATEADYTPAEVKNAASSNVATALNNNVAKLSRSIYASDLIEKAQWIDSSPVSAADASIASWVSAAANPNMFSPAFYMAFGSPSLNAGSQVDSVHFSISVTYYVAFRNPKYGGSSASKDLPARSVTFADEDDDLDDDMVDIGGDYVPPALRDDEEPAGAARAAAEPATLERRQRSAGLQANQAAAAPIRKKKNV